MGVAAGQRLKYEQYIEEWRRDGFEVDVSPFMDLSMWSIVYTEGNVLKKALGTLKGYFRRIFNLIL